MIRRAESRTLLGGSAILLFYVLNSALLVSATSIYHRLVGEDGFYENLGAAAVLAAAALFLLACRKHLRSGSISTTRVWQGLFLLAAGSACLLLFLEEISWGQRLFDIGTPAWLEEKNLQGETTLHNLAPFHHHAHQVAVLLLSAYLVTLPVLLHLSPTLSAFCRRVGLPIPDLQIAFFVLLTTQLHSIHRFLAIWMQVENEVNFGEVREVLLQLILLLFSYRCKKRLG